MTKLLSRLFSLVAFLLLVSLRHEAKISSRNDSREGCNAVIGRCENTRSSTVVRCNGGVLLSLVTLVVSHCNDDEQVHA
jgi:hypothetical protein